MLNFQLQYYRNCSNKILFSTSFNMSNSCMKFYYKNSVHCVNRYGRQISYSIYIPCAVRLNGFQTTTWLTRGLRVVCMDTFELDTLPVVLCNLWFLGGALFIVFIFFLILFTKSHTAKELRYDDDDDNDDTVLIVTIMH